MIYKMALNAILFSYFVVPVRIWGGYCGEK